MFRICYRYVINNFDAEDIVADGFIKIFSNFDKFEYRAKGSLEAWMKKIVVNECLLFLKRRQRINYTDADLYILDDTEADENLYCTDIFKIIAQMPDGYRTIFNLYIIEGYSHKEISEILNISIQTSKSQLSRAKKHLKNIITVNGYEERNIQTNNK